MALTKTARGGIMEGISENIGEGLLENQKGKETLGMKWGKLDTVVSLRQLAAHKKDGTTETLSDSKGQLAQHKDGMNTGSAVWAQTADHGPSMTQAEGAKKGPTT
jgi:hypothetical protein